MIGTRMVGTGLQDGKIIALTLGGNGRDRITRLQDWALTLGNGPNED
jgi:hypothetical protein